MKVITGCDGLIGSNLVGDVKISRKDADLLNFQDTVNLIYKLKPTTVIHCATAYSNKFFSNNCDIFLKNIRIDMNLLEACKICNVKNFLYLSSISCFPNNSKLPYQEENFFNGDISFENYGYSWSKKFGLLLTSMYSNQYNINYKSVILGNIYGPFIKSTTIISDLINRIYYAKISNNDLFLYGDGLEVKNFTYVEDLNFIFDKLIDSNVTDPVIVSTSEKISISEAVNIIAKEIGFKNKITWGKENKFSNTYCDNKKLLSIIGNFNFTKFQTGISKICKNYTKNFSISN